MNIKLTICAIALSSVFATNALAAGKKNINPWKECGIGAMIFDPVEFLLSENWSIFNPVS